MNNDLRATLNALPVPWGEGGPAAACVIENAGQWELAWQVGTSKQGTGLRFDKPRPAIAAARYLNERNEPS